MYKLKEPMKGVPGKKSAPKIWKHKKRWVIYGWWYDIQRLGLLYRFFTVPQIRGW